MKDRILFSALGFTDPTRDNYDGAYLHILRKLKPSKVFLVMTNEICEFDSRDDRYVVLGKRIAEKEGFECEITKIKYENVKEPHKFDYFKKIFEGKIEEIVKSNPESELLINLSSGTTQMKETLHLICATSMYKLKPIQVESPAKRANRSRPTADTYDIEYEWNNLLDNDEEFQTNRIVEVELENVLVMFTKERIKGYVTAYDYEAARVLAYDLKDNVSERVRLLLDGAVKRVALKRESFNDFKNAKYTPKIIEYGAASKMFEYILELDLKIKRRQYMDFIRAISPILSELFLEYLNVVCRIDVKNRYYRLSSNGIYRLDTLKNGEELKLIFNRENVMDAHMAASNLLAFICYFEKKDLITVKTCETLRNVEEKIRNKLAHEIIGIDDSQIKNIVGIDSKNIIELIKGLFSKVYKNYVKGELWNAYDDLNGEIIKEL